MYLDVSGQMLPKRLTLHLFRRGARRPGDFDWRGAFICLELFQTQFELLDLMVQLLRFASALLNAPVIGYGSEQPFNAENASAIWHLD